MLEVSGVQFKANSREEFLPNYHDSFPCVTTCYRLRPGEGAPWHWHKAVELFYVPEGELDYSTPEGNLRIPAGFGGFVNSNVPHSSLGRKPGLQQLHLFDPSLIAGHPGSLIDRKFVLPLTSSRVEMLILDPNEPLHQEALQLLQAALRLNPKETGYELRLRDLLSRIWLLLLQIAAPQLEQPGRKGRSSRTSDYLREMLVFIQEHYAEKITVDQIAASAGISQRRCFQIFRSCLHTGPGEYLTDFRIRIACQALTGTELSVTDIAYGCGLGSSSHFCSRFRSATGMTPLEYRRQFTPTDKKGEPEI